MVKRILRVLLWVFVLAGGGAIALYALGTRQVERTFDVTSHRVPTRTDDGAIGHGHRLVRLYGCTGCHGEDLGGRDFVDDPVFATLTAPNLTSGQGGIGSTYTVGDFERAIRHGVRPDGSPLFLMPAEAFRGISDVDLAAMVAYLRSLAPVDFRGARRRIGPMGRVAALLDRTILPARTIDHQAPHVTRVEEVATAEYGEYLAAACRECHGADLGGRPLAFAPRGPLASNLTPHPNALGSWTETDFDRALRSGMRPDGTSLDSLMPWFAFSDLTDMQVDALWAYLRSVPPIAGSVE